MEVEIEKQKRLYEELYEDKIKSDIRASEAEKKSNELKASNTEHATHDREHDELLRLRDKRSVKRTTQKHTGDKRAIKHYYKSTSSDCIKPNSSTSY